MFRTLRVAFGFDHLTYSGMIRLASLVLGTSVLLSLAQIHFGWGIDVLERARAQYLSEGLSGGERYLAARLESRPEDREAYILLARSRGRFERLAALQEKAPAVDYRNPGRTVPRGFFPPAYLKPFLSAAELTAFLERSVAIDPALLFLYRLAEREGPEIVESRIPATIAALQLQPNGAGANSYALLADAGDLCRTYHLTERTLEYYQAAIGENTASNRTQAGSPGTGAATALDAERAGAVRRSILETLLESGASAELAEYLSRPEYRAAAEPTLRYRYHLQRGEYVAMILPLIQSQAAAALRGELIGALIVGAGWLLFLLHMGRVNDRGPGVFGPVAIAFILGVCSALATLYVVILQDHLLGPAGEGRGLIFNLVNAIFGIGLREELIKLVFAAPLALLLLREHDALKIFTLTSLVGLGFAVAENINYYVYGGGTVIARFLTANFLHTTLTGYAGYYFVRAVQKKDKWENFSESFFLMVLCHGLYDFFLIEPSLEDYSFLAYIVYIWIAQKYLRLLVSLRHRKPGESSLTQMFILALSLAVGVGYWQLARTVGFVQGFLDLAAALLGVAIILIMFFREFDEPVARS